MKSDWSWYTPSVNPFRCIHVQISINPYTCTTTTILHTDFFSENYLESPHFHCVKRKAKNIRVFSERKIAKQKKKKNKFSLFASTMWRNRNVTRWRFGWCLFENLECERLPLYWMLWCKVGGDVCVVMCMFVWAGGGSPLNGADMTVPIIL